MNNKEMFGCVILIAVSSVVGLRIGQYLMSYYTISTELKFMFTGLASGGLVYLILTLVSEE